MGARCLAVSFCRSTAKDDAAQDSTAHYIAAQSNTAQSEAVWNAVIGHALVAANDNAHYQYPPKFYHHTDGRSSTQFVTDAEQNLVQHDQYLPSGEAGFVAGGGMMDPGRHAVYGYARNNPVMYHDPSGWDASSRGTGSNASLSSVNEIIDRSGGNVTVVPDGTYGDDIVLVVGNSSLNPLEKTSSVTLEAIDEGSITVTQSAWDSYNESKAPSASLSSSDDAAVSGKGSGVGGGGGQPETSLGVGQKLRAFGRGVVKAFENFKRSVVKHAKEIVLLGTAVAALSLTPAAPFVSIAVFALCASAATQSIDNLVTEYGSISSARGDEPFSEAELERLGESFTNAVTSTATAVYSFYAAMPSAAAILRNAEASGQGVITAIRRAGLAGEEAGALAEEVGATGRMAVLGRGSTANLANGTTVARNLRESLAIEQAMANPTAGRELALKMTDPRWPASEGWVKMQQIVQSGGREGATNVHYLLNRVTGEIDDFKIVLQGAR